MVDAVQLGFHLGSSSEIPHLGLIIGILHTRNTHISNSFVVSWPWWFIYGNLKIMKSISVRCHHRSHLTHPLHGCARHLNAQVDERKQIITQHSCRWKSEHSHLSMSGKTLFNFIRIGFSPLKLMQNEHLTIKGRIILISPGWDYSHLGLSGSTPLYSPYAPRYPFYHSEEHQHHQQQQQPSPNNSGLQVTAVGNTWK